MFKVQSMIAACPPLFGPPQEDARRRALFAKLKSLETTVWRMGEDPLGEEEYAECLYVFDRLRKRLKAHMPTPTPPLNKDFSVSSAFPFEMLAHDRVIDTDPWMQCALVADPGGRWGIAFHVYGPRMQMSNGSYTRSRGLQSFTGSAPPTDCKAMAALAAVHLAPMQSGVSVLVEDPADKALFYGPFSHFSDQTRPIVDEIRALMALKNLTVLPNIFDSGFLERPYQKTLMGAAHQAVIVP